MREVKIKLYKLAELSGLAEERAKIEMERLNIDSTFKDDFGRDIETLFEFTADGVIYTPCWSEGLEAEDD
jgi:hypothetical protein